MDRFNALGRGTQIMLVGAVLLFIDLFLPWQDFDVGDIGQFSGWRGVGVILGLLTIVLLAWIIVRLASVNIPLPVSTAMSGLPWRSLSPSGRSRRCRLQEASRR